MRVRTCGNEVASRGEGLGDPLHVDPVVTVAMPVEQQKFQSVEDLTSAVHFWDGLAGALAAEEEHDLDERDYRSQVRRGEIRVEVPAGERYDQECDERGESPEYEPPGACVQDVLQGGPGALDLKQQERDEYEGSGEPDLQRKPDVAVVDVCRCRGSAVCVRRLRVCRAPEGDRVTEADAC